MVKLSNHGMTDYWSIQPLKSANTTGPYRVLARARRGFTLIELLIVLSIIALLLTIAAPRYFGSIDRSKETVLKENLKVLRSTIDKFYGDNGRYPDTLDELVEKQYVRVVPQDPITESVTTWIVEASRDPDLKGIYNVKSGGQGKTRDGIPYSEL